MSKERLNDGFDILMLTFILTKDSTPKEIQLTIDTLWAIKSFLPVK